MTRKKLERAISIARLWHYCPLHLQPINVVVYNDPKGNLILRLASCLDAFSTYPIRLRWQCPGGTTGKPVVSPSRSSRTSVRPRKFHTPTIDRDWTVSRRSEPSSRATLMGEQPNPWDLLQPQDVTSRHRGAKPLRRYELLGGSACYPRVPFILWAMSFPCGNTGSLCSSFLPDRLVGLPVKHPYAITLYGRLPIVLRVPFRTSVTFLEATTPVKLPPNSVPLKTG